jgi:hypothetical protein
MDWLDGYGLQFEKLNEARPRIPSSDLYRAACDLFDEAPETNPLEIAHKVFHMANVRRMSHKAKFRRETTIGLLVRIQALEYMVWNLKRPWIERFMENLDIGVW